MGIDLRLVRASTIPGLRSHLKQDKPFRSVWGYNNLQYLAAGEASARVTGASWERLVQTRIFDPLGMKSSSFSAANSSQRPSKPLPKLGW